MKYSPRIYYTETDKALIWERWRKGESLTSIARHFGRGHSSIQGIVARSGGIRPVARERSPRALSLSEREEISRGLAAGRSLRSVAASLGRSPSTVSREITRMVVSTTTGPVMLSKPPGRGHSAPSVVNLARTVR